MNILYVSEFQNISSEMEKFVWLTVWKMSDAVLKNATRYLNAI